MENKKVSASRLRNGVTRIGKMLRKQFSYQTSSNQTSSKNNYLTGPNKTGPNTSTSPSKPINNPQPINKPINNRPHNNRPHSQNAETKEHREILSRLFEETLQTFNQMLVEGIEVSSILPKLTPPTFDQWYDSLDIFTRNKDKRKTDILDPERLYKLKQSGNLLVPQPTGGFIIATAMDQKTMKQQYIEAIQGENPVLMVITEPFVKGPENSSYIKYDSKSAPLGLLYNDSFEEKYSLPQTLTYPNIDSLKVAVVEIKDRKTNATIKIANWHGNSSGTKETDFKIFYNWCVDNGIDYITGDSNITSSKTAVKSRTDPIQGYTIGDVLNNICMSNPKDYSKHSVKKDRYANDIFLNNQIEKAYLKPEVDGMFIVDCKNSAKNSAKNSGNNSSKNLPELVAFDTPYSVDRPILADHSVVRLEVEGFTLMAASGAEMDHETKGIFPKDIWNDILVNQFHKNYGLPYTEAWIKIYNAFINSNPTYTDPKKPKLTKVEDPKKKSNVTGGRFTRRKRKSRRRSRTLSSSR